MIKSASELPDDFGSIDGVCHDVRDKRIAELEALNKKLALAIFAGEESFDGDEWDRLMATATIIATT